MRMAGEIVTNPEGLSEMMLWDFKTDSPAAFLMDWFGFPADILPEVRSTFCEQGRLTAEAAAELGLAEGTPVTYRAGDQPNNALSLNVFEPGEVASTAGTSGVVYGVNGTVDYDPLSGVTTSAGHNFDEMNELAAQVPAGSLGISIMPFGNGAERLLENCETGCSIHGINFNVHDRRHIIRAAQEGIVFSFMYGIEIMQTLGLAVDRIHAGKANMFLSPVFRQTLADVSGATIELYDTDGSVGAAKGAGMGAGIYKNRDEAFASLELLGHVTPDAATRPAVLEAYALWKERLNK